MSASTQTITMDLRQMFPPQLPSTKLRLRGASPPPPASTSVADIIKALSPGDVVTGSINDFTTDYIAISQAFDQLLQTAYLDQVIVDPDNDLRLQSMLLEVKGKFGVYAAQELRAARDLISLSEILSAILPNGTVGDFVHSYAEVIGQYAAGVDSNVRVKRGYFDKLLPKLNVMSQRLATVIKQLRDLIKQVEEHKASLEEVKIVAVLRDILSPVYKLSTNDEDAQVQLGVLLGVTGNALAGTFGDLWNTTQSNRTAVLVGGISLISSRLNTLSPNLSLLTNSLGPSLTAAEAISAVWTQLGDNIKSLQGSTVTLSKPDIAEISLAWKTTASLTEALIAAISSAPMKTSVAFLSESPFTILPAMPQSSASLLAMKLVEKVQGDPYVVADKRTRALRAIAQSQPVRARLIEKAVERFKKEKLAANADGNDAPVTAEADGSDDETFLKDFGPPNTSSLDRLSGDCIVIQQQFDDILRLPYLDSLQVINPFKLQPPPSTALAAQDDEPDKIDIRSMVVRYKNLYEKLQQDSIEVIRGLITYSAVQIQLLPSVTISKTPAVDQIALSDYIKANKGLIDDYAQQTAALHLKYIQFGQDWRMAILNLQNAIKTTIAEVQKNKEIIENLNEERKSKTLWGVLELLGAVALFAVGVFTLPFGLLAIGGAGALLYKSIKDLQAAGELEDAIATYQSALNTAEETQRRLEPIEAPMQRVADSITAIIDVFKGLSFNLDLIKADVGIWEKVPTLFVTMGPKVVVLWQDTSNLCDRYVDIISGKIPQT